MQEFFLKTIDNADIYKEICNIGFDKTYAHNAVNKFNYKNFKIFNLNCAQANILKQTALSVGADCATHRDVITGKIEKSDVILGGSYSQIDKIAQKLKFQPFGLKILGENLSEQLKSNSIKTKIMGVLNITENSFSDGGLFYEFDKAIEQLHKLINDGADIIDIGAESTRPGAIEISANKQLEHLEPILEYIKENKLNINISVDTRSSIVAKKAIELGACMINDVSGFDFDNSMVDVIAQNKDVKIVIQHSKGLPENMQNNPHYDNLMDEIFESLSSKVQLALSKGINKNNIIIDPGIGFGKTRENNFEILKRWRELKSIGCPILIGISRKSMLNIPNESNEQKDIYTLALNASLIQNNVDYIRVHNVKIHRKFLDIINI